MIQNNKRNPLIKRTAAAPVIKPNNMKPVDYKDVAEKKLSPKKTKSTLG